MNRMFDIPPSIVAGVADAGTGYLRVGGAHTHRQVWEYYTGEPIPKGYVIHHIDGNIKNNHILNLEMLTSKEHRAKHSKTYQINNGDYWSSCNICGQHKPANEFYKVGAYCKSLCKICSRQRAKSYHKLEKP